MVEPLPLSRRTFLKGVGLAVGAASAAPLVEAGRAFAGPGPGLTLLRRPAVAGAPSPEQLHVQFGADASRQAAVSWAAAQQVMRPKLRLGVPGEGFGRVVDAEERVYTDAMTGQTVLSRAAARFASRHRIPLRGVA